MNSKRYFLCICRKWKLLLMSLMLGMLVVTGIYEIHYCIKSSMKTYQAEALFHVEANYEEIYHHYNAYTWRDVIKKDMVLLPAMQYLENKGISLSREVLESSLDADIASDVRLLYVYVTMDSKELADVFMQGMIEGIIGIPNLESGLEEITLWSLKDASLVVHENLWLHALILGGLIGLLIWWIGVSLYYAVEDSVYTLEDVAELTDLPVLGYRCSQKNPVWDRLLLDDVQQLQEISVDALESWDFEDLAEESFVLTMKFGNHNGKKLLLLLNQLNLQHLRPKGIIIVDAEDTFLKRYYGNV